MADFTNLNLEGANEKLNKALTDAKALKDNLLASAGGDASTILASLESKVSDLQSSFADMIPELPTIPNINMQSEFAQLANFDITSPQYPSQIANITSQFGPAMKAKGLDIESLAEQILAGGSIGDLLPNLQLPDGELIPVELPAEVSLPSVEAIEEKISKVNLDKVTLKTPEVEVVTTVSGTTTTTTTTTGGETTTTDSEVNFEDLAKARLKEKLKVRTIIPGTFKNGEGEELPIQKYTDEKIYTLEIRAGVRFGVTNKTEQQKRLLPKTAYRRYFQSDTDDDGKKTDKSFLAAKEKGDWDWKKDSAGVVYYDNRYKKNRKT
jgi:hypothetical protein